MNILVLGSGGREHALCWAIAKSPLTEKLYCAPGNGGIAQLAECIPCDVTDADAISAICRQRSIGLVVIGPEDPLVSGVADALRAENIRVFGPSQLAARVEGSKAFTKELCTKYNIPTAAYECFTALDKALAYVRGQSLPIVIKADGLAAGKGVVVAQTMTEAESALGEMFGGKFGAAGHEVVIEEFMEGEEVSFFALCDGKDARYFGAAQDHKRVFDGDEGPNTGGMGTYAPTPVFAPEMEEVVMKTIIEPAVKGLTAEGCPYQGVLFAGLMMTATGPRLIEFNARFGDPETQVLMHRLKSDLVPLLIAVADAKLDHMPIEFFKGASVCVVMATRGYPGDYPKGSEIRNLSATDAIPQATVFHAGTRSDKGRFIATGGRVLGVTASGATIQEARDNAYRAVDLIDWPEGFCRRDIAWRALKTEAA